MKMKNEIDIVTVKLKLEKKIKSDKHITDPESAIEIIGSEIKDSANEILYIANLNTHNQVINISPISIGTINSSLLHPREVFNRAILSNAKAVMLFHNHPTGDVMPSGTDIFTTKRMVIVGKIVGIEVLDHIIVGAGTDKYFSFLEANMLETDFSEQDLIDYFDTVTLNTLGNMGNGEEHEEYIAVKEAIKDSSFDFIDKYFDEQPVFNDITEKVKFTNNEIDELER